MRMSYFFFYSVQFFVQDKKGRKKRRKYSIKTGRYPELFPAHSTLRDTDLIYRSFLSPSNLVNDSINGGLYCLLAFTLVFIELFSGIS